MNIDWVEILISVGIFVAGLIFSKPFMKFILTRVVNRFTKMTKSSIDDFLIAAIQGPLRWGLVLAITQYAALRISFWEKDQETTLENIFFIAQLFVGLSIAIRVVNSFSQWYVEEISPTTKSNLDNQLLPFFRRMVVIGVVIMGGIILLEHFEIDVSGLVTTLGIGSLAIALAAQAALSDTISGFMIMIDRPFRIGDRVEIGVLNTWGDVEDIGLRSTRIKTRDNRMVVVPNSEIAKNLIVNHSFPDSQYRIQIEIGVAYGSDIEEVRKIMVETVEKVEGVLTDRPVEALFLDFGDSALTFRVRWWLESYVDTRRMFDKVNTALYKNLNAANIEIPFPQQEVVIRLDEGTLEKVNQAVNLSKE